MIPYFVRNLQHSNLFSFFKNRLKKPRKQGVLSCRAHHIVFHERSMFSKITTTSFTLWGLQEVRKSRGTLLMASAYDRPFMFDRFSVNDLYHPLKDKTWKLLQLPSSSFITIDLCLNQTLKDGLQSAQSSISTTTTAVVVKQASIPNYRLEQV